MRRLPLESWKYTPLPEFGEASPTDVQLHGVAPLPDAVVPSGGRIIFQNGAFDPARSFLPEGLTLSLEPGSGSSVLPEKAFREDSVISDLNAAASEGGVRLTVDPKAGGIVEPLEVLFWTQGDVSAPRLEVVCLAGVSLTLIERHEGACAAKSAVRIDIKIKSGATVEHVRLQCAGEAAVLLSLLDIKLDPGAGYRGFHYTDGARLSRNQIEADLGGPESSFSLESVTLLRGARIGDLTTRIRHAGPGARSIQKVRTVLDGQAKGVYQGCISVAPGADGTDARQTSKALILSEGAEMDTKPELEILADDVKCTHGAATGSLDPWALFYLRSRGIPFERARALLIEGFVSELLADISREEVAAAISARRNDWLEAADRS